MQRYQENPRKNSRVWEKILESVLASTMQIIWNMMPVLYSAGTVCRISESLCLIYEEIRHASLHFVSNTFEFADFLKVYYVKGTLSNGLCAVWEILGLLCWILSPLC